MVNAQHSSNPIRRGFTIVELIVAIGITFVLIVGIGKIFTMSKDTISIGTSTAQLAQYGRTLEMLMRQDFASIVRGGGGYLVIRNERLGLSEPGDKRARSSENNRPVYLNVEMKEADEINTREVVNMGVRRMDQIVFYATGEFTTYQYRDTPFGGGIARNDTSQVAMIRYGHGLRDPQPYDYQDPLAEIKRGGGVDNYAARFADDRLDDEANYYARDWILARQPALLMPRSSVNASGQLDFVPSPIEFFNEFGDKFFQKPYTRVDHNSSDPLRRLSPGRVDLIDMDLVSVGKAVAEYGYARIVFPDIGDVEPWPDPFRGIWDEENRAGKAGNQLASFLTQDEQQQIGRIVSELWAAGQRKRMAFSTGRIRVESAPPSIARADQMLTHATLIPGCSHFEVAWSTGEIEYPSGNLVWYDIENPANPHVQRPDKSRSETQAEAPSDPRTWYLSELTWQQLWPDLRLNERQREDLYYATFGSFVPKENDVDRNEPWPWPTLIRIRVVLHDRENRIVGGRSFEYIFRLPAVPETS